ncbi:MAG TPA: glycoside hydrolase domain-containing protein, partial [Kribbella sp.]|nr:glycoside hydrolase domain-containing protein [Kribbella sp.]
NFVVPTIRTAPGDFPDRLLNRTSIDVPANQTQSIWVRVHVPATAAGGIYTGHAIVRTSNGNLNVPIRVNARNVVIPPANQSEFTNVMWTNFLGLTSWDIGAGDTVKLFYGHDRYSPQWWQLIDNWADTMKRYRQNDLQLPLINLLTDGGSKVDAAGNYTFNFERFDQVVQRFLDKGVVSRLEGFTGAGPQNPDRNPQYPRYLQEVTPKETGRQVPDFVYWDSPEADNWYKQFYPALRQHLVDKGWLDKFWMHVGDEPGAGGDPGWFGIANKLRQYWPDVKIGDAVTNDLAARVAHAEDIVIPNLFTYTLNPKPFDDERKAGKPMWFYNCNIPAGNHLNRFIDQPEWNQRQTMWLAYGKGATGYLHWAYGNWQFKMSDQTVKGDGYIVRPDTEHNTVEASPRYESLRDGMEDWEVLNHLGKTNPGLAHDLANAVVQASDKYSPDVSYMQRIRAIALDAAAGLPLKGLRYTRTGLQFDLGRQAQVDGIKLHWGATWPSKYHVLISYDGTKWAEAANRTDDPANDLAKPGGDDFLGINAKTRYLRITVDGTAPYDLQGVEVAGTHLPQQNLAGGKTYDRTAPSARFPDAGNEATDGVLGDNWGDGKQFGYQLFNIGDSVQPVVNIDLGSAQSVGKVRVHAYEEYPDYRPDRITVATSEDGVNFTDRGQVSAVNGASRIWYDVGFTPAKARFVRVTFDKTMHDKYQTGVFIDEIEAYQH